MNNSGKAKIIIIVLASLLVLSLTACGILVSKLISAENELNIDKQWHSKAISPSEASLDGIYSEEYMQKAIYNAVHNEGIGGPVGAVITKGHL